MFQQSYAQSMPGIGPSTYSRGRAIWLGLAGVQYLPAGGIIASRISRDPDNFDSVTNQLGGNETEVGTAIVTPPNATTSYVGILEAGLLMGRIGNQGGSVTNSLGVLGQYRPSIIGVTTAAVTAGATTSLTVTAQCATEVARLITVVGGNVSLNIVAIDTANSNRLVYTNITVTAASGTTLTTSSFTPANTGAYAAGAFITPVDGSQYPVTFVDEQFGLNMLDGQLGSLTGNIYTGGATLYQAPFPRIPIAGGTVNVANVVNYPTTTNTGYATLRAWIKASLNSAGGIGGGSTATTVTTTSTNYGGRFMFSDDY
jgi:hypothetical protein